MAITPSCDFCKKELQTYGGLLFSPPDQEGKTKKWHICTECYIEFEKKVQKEKIKY